MMIDFSIYLITDRKLFASNNDFFIAIDEALKSGVQVISLREKDMKIRDLMQMAYCLRELTLRYGAKLFINDRLDVALACHADGVHLPQSGLPVDAVKAVVQDNMMVGVSTHSIAECHEAYVKGADFVTFGPIFKTPSKMKYGKPLGVDNLKMVTKSIKIPVFAIGGIKPHNTAKVLKAGVKGIAMITGILGQHDIKEAVNRYKNILGE